MITRTTRACLVAASLCVLSGVALAADLPRQGSSMDDVRKHFGAPASDLGAIGSPAITRWVYDGFTVYFEGRRVIQTVQTQPFAAGAAASPAPAAQPVPVQQPLTIPQPAPVAPAPVAPQPALAPVAAPVAAPKPFEPAPAPAVAAPVPVEVSSPVVGTPAVNEQAAPPPAKPAGSAFRFDPATGRLVIDGESTGEAAGAGIEEESPAAEASAPADAAPDSAQDGEARTPAGETGAPPEEELVFDPETGTFKPKQ